MHLGRLDVLGIDAVIADVRIGQCDHLARVAGIGQDFLIAGHGGVKYHFPGRMAGGADGNTFKYCSVCEHQNGWDGRARKKWRQG